MASLWGDSVRLALVLVNVGEDKVHNVRTDRRREDGGQRRGGDHIGSVLGEDADDLADGGHLRNCFFGLGQPGNLNRLLKIKDMRFI